MTDKEETESAEQRLKKEFEQWVKNHKETFNWDAHTLAWFAFKAGFENGIDSLALWTMSKEI